MVGTNRGDDATMKFLVYMKDNKWTKDVREYFISLREKGHEVTFWRPHIPWEETTIPADCYNMEMSLPPTYDWVISYLSPHILTREELSQATKGAINFHPGPPEYPGTGCYNFAIMNDADFYGVTCHFMEEKVDTGPIINIKTFELPLNITVKDLQWRSMIHLQRLFFEVMDEILEGYDLHPAKPSSWNAEPYTRRDLQELCAMTPETISAKRLRATYYPNARDPPTLKIGNKRWRLEPL